MVALTTRILPAITFTLALTTLTVKQCKRISVILEDTVLPQMGKYQPEDEEGRDLRPARTGGPRPAQHVPHSGLEEHPTLCVTA